MKKYLEIAVGVMAAVGAVASAQAQQNAVNACTGSAAGTPYTVAGTTDQFVAVTFTGNCSANVFLSYQQNATVMAVAAASRKGANTFSGSTNGGAIRPDTGQKCASSGCAQDKVTGALSTAYTKATSS